MTEASDLLHPSQDQGQVNFDEIKPATSAQELPTTENSKLERSQQLEKVGFQKLGHTSLFRNEGFLIGVGEDGRFTFFNDYSTRPFERLGGIKGIAIRNYMGKEDSQMIVHVGQNDEGKEWAIGETIGGSGGPVDALDKEGTVPRVSDFEGKGFGQQLLEAGFEALSEEDGLYHAVLKDHNKEHDIYAFLDGDKLGRIVKPAERYFYSRRRGREIVERIGIQLTGIEESEFGNKVLKGRNDAMEFGFDQNGGLLIDRFLRDFTPEELGIDVESSVETSGFVVGGVNNTETIKQLESINGVPVYTLEALMAPHRFEGRGGGISMAGFLGENEKLIDVLAADNDFVLSQGLTHQDLGKMLLYAEGMFDTFGVSEFSYRGRNFRLSHTQWRGFQESPFKDDTRASSDIVVENVDTGKSLSCSTLLGPMVTKYGFYEGKGTSYRLDPQEIIDVFDFLKEDGQKNQQSQNS